MNYRLDDSCRQTSPIAGLVRARMVLRLRRAIAGVLLGLFLAPFGGAVLADVRETPHNLIRSRDKSVDEKQVCVFCHTPALDSSRPEGSAPAVTGSPAWQRGVSDTFSFTIYDDIGRLGQGRPSVGSQSIACLSCHDANQADGSARISMDHPYGVPYRGATRDMLPAGSSPTSSRDPMRPFREARHLLYLDDFRDVSQGMVDNRQVFWVSRQGMTARRTRADLPLYARVVTGMPANSELAELEGMSVPHVECSSCHDPHARTATFLRVPPEESKLCLTCHDK